MNLLQNLAEISADRLLNSAAEGFLIALLAWVLLRLLGRQNSGTRFVIWFSALLMIGALPFVTVHRTTTAAASHPELSIPSSWAGYIFAVWALIALFAVLRVGHGLWRVRKLRADCVPLENSPLCSFVVNKNAFTTKNTKVFTKEHKGRLEQALGRNIRVCVSDQVKVPTAIGFFRPMIVIPQWALDELSSEEMQAVLLHELAHLRRWDDWSNLAQKIIRALLFFHPAVWWIDNRLTLEREMACDELVLDQTANPRAYAECLVSLAEKNFLRRGLAMAQAAVGRIKHMSLRIGRILDTQRPGASRSWKPAMALLATFSAAGLVVMSRTAPLIGFEGHANTAILAQKSAEDVGLPKNMIVSAGLHAPVQTAHAQSLRQSISSTFAGRDLVTAQSQPKSLRVDGPQLIPARVKTRQTQRAVVVQAKANRPTVAPEQMFVVVQAEYFASPHEVVWTMTVWRVDRTTAPQQQAVAGVDPRSI